MRQGSKPEAAVRGMIAPLGKLVPFFPSLLYLLAKLTDACLVTPDQLSSLALALKLSSNGL